MRTVAAKITAGVLLALVVAACGGSGNAESASGGCTIVATTPILGAAVSEMVGDQATVSAVIPNGSDFHDFEASAKQVAGMTEADLLVTNGLDLEQGLGDAIDAAGDAGARVFVATDHIAVRGAGGNDDAQDDHENEDDHDSEDPHFWLDPLAMRDVTIALGTEIEAVCPDVAPASMAEALDRLHAEVAAMYADLPADRRNIVSGHDSLGYHAQRYDLTVVGALIPSLSTQAEATAANLADLTRQIEELGVCTVFADIAESPDIAEAIAAETGARVVALPISELPDEGTYEAYLLELAAMLRDGLGAEC